MQIQTTAQTRRAAGPALRGVRTVTLTTGPSFNFLKVKRLRPLRCQLPLATRLGAGVWEVRSGKWEIETETVTGGDFRKQDCIGS